MKFPERVQSFIDFEFDDCHKNGIQMELSSSESGGYFIDKPFPKLFVGTKGAIKTWFPTFVHETCHKDQYKENAIPWRELAIDDVDVHDILDLWLNDKITLKTEQKTLVLNKLISAEIDCEKRTAKKILEHKLPINIDNYIKTANAYVLSYHFLLRYRKWTSGYADPRILKLMPASFTLDYQSIEPKLLRLYAKVDKEVS